MLIDQGRIQEFWLGGAWIFFSKAWGSGPALRSPVGPGQRPGGFPGGEAPGTSWILAILGVKFNHIISPHRWLDPRKKKCTCTFIDTT